MIKNLNNIFYNRKKWGIVRGIDRTPKHSNTDVCLNNSKIRKLFVDVHE